MSESNHTEILVIGGGVIGVCAAYYLAQAGQQVTLLEKDEICAGSSYGNAGLVAVEHAVPPAQPGVLTQGLRWLLDGSSPFYIKPRADIELLRWLWEFRAASNRTTMLRTIETVLALGRSSIALYEELNEQHDLDYAYEHKGRLYLYNSQASLDEAVEEAELLEEFGVQPKILDAAEVSQREPTVLPSVIGGVHYPGYAHCVPDRFVHGMARLVQDSGVQVQTQTEVMGFETAGGRITSVVTTRGNIQPAHVVLAAGAWSPMVVRDLGLRLPVQAAKGYSLTFERPANCPETPLALGESLVSVSQLGDTLRFAGTLELAGFDLTINQRRVAAIRRAVGAYLAPMEDLELLEVWRGPRPLTSDTLPIIGRSQVLGNLIVATGHGMLGLTHGPITGKLVAQILSGEPPDLDLTPLRIERFAGS